VMLDRYWFGDVERISPEAPVPVVRIARTEERPGGAANVARNAAALGAATTLLAVTGADEAGATLERLLAEDRVQISFHRDATLPTTVKLRVVSRQQQLLRIDFETTPSNEVLATKLADFDRLLADTDLLILSDYGKGALDHVATMIEREWDKYRGATVITPNRGEFRTVVGRWRDNAEMNAKAQKLRADLSVTALLVTRSEEGMSVYTADGVDDIPAVAREVYDVSGAGDTVIATLGVMLGAGADLRSAVRIANQAAGVVVGKLGTAVVTPDELA
jgi:rfaE bifunctional protein kinase chain/domain